MRFIILFAMLFTSCTYSVIDSSQPSVFIEIMDTDSTIHYYHSKVYETSNWCWIHNQFEDLKIYNAK
tara:strand:+ start:539 stop:739 length:201 start_codon:yes stop_codon:yes gene_type:complete